MRVLLGVFALATVALALAVARSVPSAARALFPHGASGLDGARDTVTEARPAEEPCGAGDPSRIEHAPRAASRGVPTVDVQQPEGALNDGVPVDVVVVDGEDGEVLRAATTVVERGAEAKVRFRVAAADGYVVHGGTERAEGYVSRRATRVRVLKPLRREADIRVRVADLAGRPVDRARLIEALRAGTPPAITALESDTAEIELLPEEDASGTPLKLAHAEPTGADGWTRVRGIPHLLDERYWLVFGEGKREAFTEVRLGSFGERYELSLRLPVASTRGVTANSSISCCGGCGSGYRGGRSRRVVPATLEVCVRRQDGRMGVGLKVHAGASEGTTDALGHVTFEELRPGTYKIDVRDPDFVWSESEVELHEGECRTFVVSEQPGWTARAALVDSLGRPVPFASVAPDSRAPVAYVRVEDGIQDLAFYTDERGTVSFPGMHHASVDLTFSYGSRSVSVTLAEDTPFASAQLPPP